MLTSAGARVDAAKNHGRGVLALGRCFLFRQVVSLGSFTLAKALVAAFHFREDLIRRHLVPLFPGQCIGTGHAATGTAREQHRRGRSRRYCEETASVEMAGFDRVLRHVAHHYGTFPKKGD
jgi:hypothetical protein